MICRMQLTQAESGFGPVIPFYLARWYTKRDLALRMSIFLCSGPLAQVVPRFWSGWADVCRSGVINGLVAYGISFVKHSLAPWRLLFVIEGCPAVLAGFFALAIMPGDILTTKRISEEERACGETIRSEQKSVDLSTISNRSQSPRSIHRAT